MVGVGKVRVLLHVGGEDTARRLHRGPPVRGHEGAQADPAGLTARLVKAEPAALKKNQNLVREITYEIPAIQQTSFATI